MSMTVTGGRQRTAAARVYDRLRKRSYRRNVEEMRFIFAGARWHEHEAYVAGVRDALNAMEGECSEVVQDH